MSKFSDNLEYANSTIKTTNGVIKIFGKAITKALSAFKKLETVLCRIKGRRFL